MKRCPFCFKPLPESGKCDCHYEDSSNAQIEEALRPGTVVGASYQIGGVLGQGGFGITYCGFDLDMQKIVAIKEFFPQGMVVRYSTVSKTAAKEGNSNTVLSVNTAGKDTFQKSLDLFYREAIALGRLDKQPNVVHAYRIFRENGTAYIVMEYVDGVSLKSIIKKRGRIPKNELIPLLDPVLTALHEVHQEGILHRDIAPDNIMIENGVPILLDFGASRVDEGHNSSLVIGKKGYSSYEQMAGGAQDRRSDIYAIGATYYYALSGVLPQDAGMRLIKDDLVPLKDIVPEISENTSNAVAKAMAPNPDDRWNTAAEFRDALNNDWAGEKKDQTYPEASQMAKTGTVKNINRSVQLIKQDPDHNGSEKPAKASDRKITDLQNKQKADGEPSNKNAPLTGKKPVNSKLILILIAIAAAGGILYFCLKMKSGSVSSDKKAAEQTEPAEISFLPTEIPTTENTIDPAALAQKGINAFLEKDYKKAMEYLLPSANAGNAQAQMHIGYMYDYGYGVPQSYTDAAKYYQMAADQGVSEAQWRYGYLCELGNGIEKNDKTALAYYQLSAGQDDRVGQFRLGQMYEYGKGVEQSYETASKYYKLSADQGYDPAQYSLGYLYDSGLGLTQSYEMAAKYYQLAADQGNASAQNNLGILYLNGNGVDQSYETAVKFFQAAADQGYAEGQTWLGYMYDNGKGVDQSYETAAKYYQLAAEQGDALGAFSLGYLYEWGKGVERSYETAAKYYQLSYDQGNDAAKVFLSVMYDQLGLMYETGWDIHEKTFVAPDHDMALKYYQLAADLGYEPAIEKLKSLGENQAEVTEPEKEELKVGDFLSFGHYERSEQKGAEPIEWQVLAIDNGRALLLSRYVLEAKPYNASSYQITWEKCDLRSWLNQSFYNSAFTISEAERIQEVLNSNQDNPDYGKISKGGNETTDKIFLLSFDEIQKYLPSQESRQCEDVYKDGENGANEGETLWWWLRTPGVTNSSAMVVTFDGWIGGKGTAGFSVDTEGVYVRPALWINL